MQPPEPPGAASAAPERVLGPEELAAVGSLWKRTGRELRARFGGSSMRPTLSPETEVVLRCGARFGPGDIVAYLAPGGLVLHRIEAVAPRDGSLLTRGDALWLPDALVRDREAVVGVVTALRRGDRLEPPPPPPGGLLRRGALWPFRAALRADPRAAAALLGPLIAARRLLASLARALTAPPSPEG
jgi:hypothetical protein